MSRFPLRNIFNIKIVAETIQKELERRRIQLWMHRFLYYKYDNSQISDYEYDLKEYEYKVLKKFYSWFEPQGSCPLEAVGAHADDKTAEKADYLANIILNPKKPKAKPSEPTITPPGQLSLFTA